MDLVQRVRRELTSYVGHMAFYARDFHGNRFALYEDEPFETASTIKSFILLDLYEQVHSGAKRLEDELNYEERLRAEGSGVLHQMVPGLSLSAKNTAILMIIISDNTATNMMIDYLGLDHINETIRKYGFSGTRLHHPIDWELYDRLGTTTARDYGEFFFRLHEGELVSKEFSDEMIAIFSNQHYNTMLVGEFPQYYLAGDECAAGETEKITVASKSGSMDACRNDGGIVFTPSGDYVLAMLHKDFHDPLYHPGHEAQRFGAKVSRLVLEQFLARGGRLA